MAMEKGIPLPELPDFAEPGRSALAAAVASLRINPRWPLGRGALFAMVGAGTSLALWLTPERDPHNAWPVGLIGVFGSATPDGPYEAALESERMRAVARLVEELRSVVRMHYWMDQSIEEIAGALDVPAGTVKSYLARARQRLRERAKARGIEGLD